MKGSRSSNGVPLRASWAAMVPDEVARIEMSNDQAKRDRRSSSGEINKNRCHTVTGNEELVLIAHNVMREV